MTKKRAQVCRHRHRFFGWTGQGMRTMMYRCRCGHEVTREMTDEEFAEFSATKKRDDKKAAQLHVLWSKLRKQIINDQDRFKYRGFELMTRLRRFASKNPRVKIVHTDDDVHASSLLALVPHENSQEYWGTTMVTAPQFGEPTILFFYPENAQEMADAMVSVCERHVSKPWRGSDWPIYPLKPKRK